MVVSFRGGLTTSIPFADLNQGPVTISDKGARFGNDWQIFEDGINLIGDHEQSTKCEASGKMVFVPLGLGEKNMSKEVVLAACRLC